VRSPGSHWRHGIDPRWGVYDTSWVDGLVVLYPLIASQALGNTSTKLSIRDLEKGLTLMG
jgi:hypothetical protein